MKRKTLLNNLKKDYSEELVRNTLKEAGIRSDVRAEALPLERLRSFSAGWGINQKPLKHRGTEKRRKRCLGSGLDDR